MTAERLLRSAYEAALNFGDSSLLELATSRLRSARFNGQFFKRAELAEVYTKIHRKLCGGTVRLMRASSHCEEIIGPEEQANCTMFWWVSTGGSGQSQLCGSSCVVFDDNFQVLELNEIWVSLNDKVDD